MRYCPSVVENASVTRSNGPAGSLFAGRWALVTGASSGLGAEMARSLARRGSNLILTARSQQRLDELASDLGRVNGIAARAIAEDLSAPGGSARLLESVAALGVPVELLVNNAGFGSAGPLATRDGERETAMVRLNVEAVVALTRGLLGPMLEAQRGGVINVASTAAFQPVPYMATYAATKSFVLSFTLALATELEGSGVHAMAFCPGPVETGFQEAAGIQRPGLSAAVLSANRSVEGALHAFERGRTLYVPGVVNTAQTLAARVVPRGVLSWAAVRAMRRWGRV